MYAIKNISRRPVRTALIVIGISLSIGLSICIFSLSSGIDHSIHSILEERGVDVYVVPKGAPVFLQNLFPPLSEGRNISRSLSRNPHIAAAGPRLLDSVYLTDRTPEEMAERAGSDDAEAPLDIYHAVGKGRVPGSDGDFGGEIMKEGRYLPTRDDPFYQNGSYRSGPASPLFTREIVLDVELARLLEVKVGEFVYLAGDYPQTPADLPEWSNRTIRFRITGIMEERYEGEDMPSCVLHLSELQYILGHTKFDKVSKIFVELTGDADSGEVKEWIENDSPYARELSAYTDEEYEVQLREFTDVLGSFGGIISVISGTASVVFVATVVILSVRERKREIGTLKSLGISTRTIIFFFLSEITIICSLGFVLGLLLGYAGNHIVEYLIDVHYGPLPAAVVLTDLTVSVVRRVTLFAFLITFLASLVPTYLISRMPPVNAMRGV